ncbi:hypothetical protein GGF43_000669 [Coemansia sp. RSA 2618]|nr:hypothetical protein GGF43_000669 [Coemansia sp. RSA 2618]
MGAGSEQKPAVEQPLPVPDSIGMHASISAPDAEHTRRSTGSRRNSTSTPPKHRRQSSTGSIKRKIGSLFHKSSRSSLQPASPKHERRASGSDDIHRAGAGVEPRLNGGSSGSSSDEEDGELPSAAMAEETLAKIEGSSFLLSDDSEDSEDSDDSARYAAQNYSERIEGENSADENRPSMRSASTFTAQYKAVPTPGMWSDAPKRAENAQPADRPNAPLEPEEHEDSKMPWIIDQMGLGEQSFSSLFQNDVGFSNVYADSDFDSSQGSGRNLNKRRRRKHAFGVLKARVGEARVGVQKDTPAPDVESFRRPDGTADYLDFLCSWIKHYADTQLSHKLDFRHNSSDPCKLDRFLITLQRLVEVSAPYQRFAIWLYKLARWDNPKLTIWWCLVYFMLLYQGMLSMFMWMLPAFIVAYHRLRPSQAFHWLGFERPETSLIPSKMVQEASSGTIAKGLIANRMWDIWRDTLGAHTHVFLADLADWMERAKNGATWKRPWASRVVIIVLTCMGLFVYLIPAAVFQKLFGICVGVQFFFLAPLQLRYQRYRHMLWIVDIILWHCPNDVELALDTLYIESHGSMHSGPVTHAPTEESQQSFFARVKAYMQVLVADMVYAYSPFANERRPPVMVLQTASSTALDQMGDDMAESSVLFDAFAAGKQLGKNMLRDSGKGSDGEDEYTGLGADSGTQFPSVMGEREEREWLQQSGLAPRSTRVFSTDTLSMLDGENFRRQAPKARETNMLSQINASRQSTVPSGSGDSSGTTSPKRRTSLISKAKGLTSRVLRRKSSISSTSDSSSKHDKANQVSPVRHSGVYSVDDISDEHERERKRRLRFSLDLHDIDLSQYSVEDLGLQSTGTLDSSKGISIALPDSPEIKDTPRGSFDSMLLQSPVATTADGAGLSPLELTHDANELQSLRNKDARATKDGIDLSSLYAFRCIHQGKYGTLFVTSDRFVFRRSRIMGGRRSSVASYLLSSVVAIRKSASGLGKSHGVQLLLSTGKSYSFYGLSGRDDVFGFLLMRCGNRHLY